MRLFFILLFLGINSYSQRVLIEEPDSLVNSSLDTINNRILLYYEDYYETIDLKTFKKSAYKVYIEEDKYTQEQTPLAYSHISIDNQNYFTHGGGGMVYTLQNDTIKRIDKSFNHKMQHGAALFAHDSKIFKYGGYGFWSVRDFFTYFDTYTKEWEVYRPVNSDEIPVGTYGGYHIKIDNDIYLFDGSKIDPHNRWKRLMNNEIWTFNFNSNEWDYLGTHSPIKRNVHVKYKNKLLFIEEKYLTVIDVRNNTISLFEHNPTTAKTSFVKSLFFFNNKFYMLIANENNSYIDILDEKDFFGKKISEEKFYKNSKYWWSRSISITLISFLIILLFWFVKKKYKKRNKIKLLDNGLRYKNKFTEFDAESMEIIKSLLSEKEIPSNRILSMVEKEQYSPAHNERIKVQKINDVNLKIKTLLGTNDDVIRSVKSESDRRIRIYRISREYFG